MWIAIIVGALGWAWLNKRKNKLLWDDLVLAVALLRHGGPMDIRLDINYLRNKLLDWMNFPAY